MFFFPENSDTAAAAFSVNILISRNMSGVFNKMISFRLKGTFFSKNLNFHLKDITYRSKTKVISK